MFWKSSKLVRLMVTAATVLAAYQPLYAVDEIVVSGQIGMGYVIGLNEGNITRIFGGETYRNLSQNGPNILPIRALATARPTPGSIALDWNSGSVTWDSPELDVKFLIKFVPVVTDVAEGVEGYREGDPIALVDAAIDLPKDLHALIDAGPTETSFTIPMGSITVNGANVGKVSVTVPLMKFDVVIPANSRINMNQSPVVLETLSVSGQLAGNGNGLTVHGAFVNSGIITNLGGTAEGDFTNGDGGNVSISQGFRVDGTFANQGNLTVSARGLLVHGNIFNLGKLTVGNASDGNNGTGSDLRGSLSLNQDSSFSGSGEIFLNNGRIIGGTAEGAVKLSIAAGQSVHGWGTIGPGILIDSHGVISADSAGKGLTFLADVTNGGTLSAINGGSIAVQSGARITGGTIIADGGTVTLNAAEIIGSTLSGGAGGFTVENATFDHVSSYAPIQVNRNLTIAGGIFENNRTIIVGKGIADQPTANLIFGTFPAASLVGSGDVLLSNGSIRGTIPSTTLAVISTQKIHGWGSIGLGVNFDSYGAISADSPGRTLVVGDNSVINNFGSLKAENGGVLAIVSATINGGPIDAKGGTVTMNGALLSKSMLGGSGGGYVSVVNATFDRVINNATVFVENGSNRRIALQRYVTSSTASSRESFAALFLAWW